MRTSWTGQNWQSASEKKENEEGEEEKRDPCERETANDRNNRRCRQANAKCNYNLASDSTGE